MKSIAKWGREVERWLVAAVVYFLLAAGTILLTSDGWSIATVWPADAALLALLLRGERTPWVAVLSAGMIANVAANLVTRDAMLSSLLYGTANMVGIAAAAFLLRRRVETAALLGTPQSVGTFLAVAGVIAPCVSALVGASIAWGIAGQPLLSAFLTWYLADALGLIVFTPLLLATVRGEFARALADSDERERIEAIVLQLFTALFAYAVFFVAQRSMLYMMFVPVTLVTFRTGRLGTKAAVSIIAVVGAIATMSGHGPVPRLTPDPLEQAMLFQAFLATLLLCSLPAAAALAAQRATMAALGERQALLERREAELSVLAATDSLTGLLNRGAFRSRVEQVLANAAAPSCLLAIDLDRFKEVNDRFGHAAGDAALVHVAGLLTRHLRPGDVIGRLGGDEFMVLLPDTDAAHAALVVRRLHGALRAAPLALGENVLLPLGMSIGIGPRDAGAAFDDVAADADAALYRAKFERRRAA